MLTLRRIDFVRDRIVGLNLHEATGVVKRESLTRTSVQGCASISRRSPPLPFSSVRGGDTSISGQIVSYAMLHTYGKKGRMCLAQLPSSVRQVVDANRRDA